MPADLVVEPPAATLQAGVSRRDITPPVGIFNRMWGAAPGDTADGVHRPITATVLAIRASAEQTPLLLVSLDWCIIDEPEDLKLLRQPLVDLCGGDDTRVVLACTHTHGVGAMGSSRRTEPGGDLIAPYLAVTATALEEAASEALEQSVHTTSTLTFGSGRCDLAANRDLPDPSPDRHRYLCGYNPSAPADDTLLVGRLTADEDGTTLATIVNYACHPTTLAWENSLLSPDYIGAMRELVEEHTHAPCLFLQGASGELAPRFQYVGDTKLPDRLGRQLGYSVLSVLASMLAPCQSLAFTGAQESGAPLAVWRPQPFSPAPDVDAVRFDVAYPLKDEYTTDQLATVGADLDARVLAERIRRRNRVLSWLGDTSPAPVPAWLWRLGSCVFLAQPAEPYAILQKTLRDRFPGCAIVVMNVANGSAGYVPPAELYDYDIYQVWQTPFAAGCLDLLLARASDEIAGLTGVAARPESIQ